MSKELELIRLLINGANEYEKETGNKNPTVYLSRNNLLVIEKALQRLESIDNANPSEALECLEKIIKGFNETAPDIYGIGEVVVENVLLHYNQKEVDTIEQALLKAQEQEKENELLKAFIADCEKGETPLKSALFREKKENELLKAKAQKEHNSINLLMQELDCKDFAELRKYARCGYEKLNKSYLKWEDLEFKEKTSQIEVKLNKTLYTLSYVKRQYLDFVYLINNDSQIRLNSANDKQFFNDLHLERVVE